MDQQISKSAELINHARKILVFTGAGLSTESGIPDFRSPGGIWDRFDPADFLFQKILSDEKTRERYWKMSTELYDLLQKAVPNRAHLAIKELEDLGKLLAVVTQNIDGLHHKAGNSPDKIIEIHGTALSVSCLDCGKKYDRDEIEGRLRSGIKVPYCDGCAGILKPDTISFGQAMPEDKVGESLEHATESDLCMALGTSLLVYPAAAVPAHAVNTGAKLLIINRDETPMDRHADLVIHDSVTQVLDQIMDKVSILDSPALPRETRH